MSAVSVRLGDVAPIKAVRPVADDAEQVFTLAFEETDGLEMGFDAISDGTLRFLALATLSESPAEGGLTCLEEPENGIYPGNLERVNRLLQDIAVDPWQK